jgi:hypothetical protein
LQEKPWRRQTKKKKTTRIAAESALDAASESLGGLRDRLNAFDDEAALSMSRTN